MEATRANGLSSSCQARTSPPIWICSSPRAFSNAGVIQAGSPSAVITAPKKRSLRHHSAPVKYSRLVPEARPLPPARAFRRGSRRGRRRRGGGAHDGRASRRLWYPRSFMAPRPGRVLLLALFLLAGATAARAAYFPPGLVFRSVSTDHVTVHYHQGLEAMARRAATLATAILERHEARYGVHVGRVQIVLADVQDDPNGFATPLPYPLVHIRVV